MGSKALSFAVVVAFFVAVLAGSVGTAYADAYGGFRIQIIPVANSPFVVTSAKEHANTNDVAVAVLNRSNHQLLAFDVRYIEYDADGTPIGHGEFIQTLAQPLIPGDSNVWMDGLNDPMVEGWNAVTRVTFRVQQTTLSGLHKWIYGQKWNGPLSPLPPAAGSGL